MEQQRNILLILFLVLSLFLYWNWESDKLASAQRAEQQAIRAEQMLANAAQDSSIGKLITLKSDSLALTLDLNGGDIVDARLLKVMQEQGKDDPFHLLMDTPDFLYIAQSGLVGRDGPDSKVRPTYTTDATEYVLSEGEDSVSANLVYEGEGYTVTKTYTLHRAPEGSAEEHTAGEPDDAPQLPDAHRFHQKGPLGKADAAAQGHPEQDGHHHKAQAAHLDEGQDHRLTKQGEGGEGIADHQAGDAGGRGGNEEGVKEGDALPGGKGQAEQRRPRQNH